MSLDACLVSMSVWFLVATAADGAYLPLLQGNSWEYRTETESHETQIVDGFEMVFGTECSAIRYTDSTHNEGLRNFWTSESNGSVLLWGFRRPGLGYAYDPPIEMVRAPLSVGQMWQQTVDVYSYPDMQILFEDVLFESEVVSGGMVDVPAGQFEAFQVDLKVLDAVPLEALHGVRRSPLAGDPFDRHWWSSDVGDVQYGVSDVYRLVAFNGGPTPAAGTSWGQIKADFRVIESASDSGAQSRGASR
jgi:hypothetical protein